MKLHTNKITEQHLLQAALDAGVRIIYAAKSSRSHDHAWSINLRGSSNFRPGDANTEPGDKAATWDEWGEFLAMLFAIDEDATTGTYVCEDHFHWATGSRFALAITDPHKQHRWKFAGVEAGATVQECAAEECSATRRFLAGRTWEEIA